MDKYEKIIEEHGAKFAMSVRIEDACLSYYKSMEGKEGIYAQTALDNACKKTGANQKTILKIISTDFGIRLGTTGMYRNLSKLAR